MSCGRNRCSLWEFSFVSDSFAVMLIDVEDMSAFPADSDDKEWLFVNFVISNIASELANERHVALRDRAGSRKDRAY